MSWSTGVACTRWLKLGYVGKRNKKVDHVGDKIKARRRRESVKELARLNGTEGRKCRKAQRRGFPGRANGVSEAGRVP